VTSLRTTTWEVTRGLVRSELQVTDHRSGVGGGMKGGDKIVRTSPGPCFSVGV